MSGTTSEVDAATKLLGKACQKLQGIQDVPSQRVMDLEASIRLVDALTLEISVTLKHDLPPHWKMLPNSIYRLTLLRARSSLFPPIIRVRVDTRRKMRALLPIGSLFSLKVIAAISKLLDYMTPTTREQEGIALRYKTGSTVAEVEKRRKLYNCSEHYIRLKQIERALAAVVAEIDSKDATTSEVIGHLTKAHGAVQAASRLMAGNSRVQKTLTDKPDCERHPLQKRPAHAKPDFN